ncbi:Hypothetical predicted protein [Octopus vulgaris]|uniref:Uncharacterized protein n=1 Tax=Octopus vulgaris TaxID=6645 RepID=A0AA36AU36_OCTVU|nr:Hypothetical predicted protein [Octopus vulgaris]
MPKMARNVTGFTNQNAAFLNLYSFLITVCNAFPDLPLDIAGAHIRHYLMGKYLTYPDFKLVHLITFNASHNFNKQLTMQLSATSVYNFTDAWDELAKNIKKFKIFAYSAPKTSL